jgi:hypothetical protein
MHLGAETILKTQNKHDLYINDILPLSTKEFTSNFVGKSNF